MRIHVMTIAYTSLTIKYFNRLLLIKSTVIDKHDKL